MRLTLTLSNRQLFLVISASSDNTIRLWKRNENEKQLKHLITERAHGDYVKCLAAPHQFSNVFASGGLDCNVKIWDVERLTASQMVEGMTDRLFQQPSIC